MPTGVYPHRKGEASAMWRGGSKASARRFWEKHCTFDLPPHAFVNQTHCHECRKTYKREWMRNQRRKVGKPLITEQETIRLLDRSIEMSSRELQKMGVRVTA